MPALELDRVEPSWGFNGDETTVVVSGDGLYPRVTTEVGGDRAHIDAQFAARLEGEGSSIPLDGVELLDYGRLEARVPVGIEPGRYDLWVTSPGGEVATLDRAFLVTDSRADHLALDAELRPYTVNETVTVTISLLDNLDEIVPDDLEIFVQFESDQEESGLLVNATGVLNAVIDEEAHTIAGYLNPDGQARFAFTSTVPDNVKVIVSPADNATVVRDADVFIPFTTGVEASVALVLPEEDLTVTAGEAFAIDLYLVDEFGNVLTDRSASVFLRELCGGSQGMPTEAVDLVGGYAQVLLSLVRATSERPGSDCLANGIEAYGGFQGQSEGVLVRPAAVRSLAVLIAGAEDGVVVTAGEPELSTVVRAEDPYGNAVLDYAVNVQFTDSEGGLDSRGEAGSVGCFPWIDGLLPCVISLDVAAEDVVLFAETDTGVRGQSEAFDVQPGAAAGLELTLPAGPIVAGSYFELTAQVVDRLGNAVDMDLSGVGVVQISDDHGGTSCNHAADLGTGMHAFGCLSTVADPAIHYTVALSALGISATSDAMTVTNGDLAVVSLSLPSTVVAGASFTLTGTAADAWGNPYTVGDPSLSLVDSTGSLVPSATTISSAGLVSTTVSISRASPSVDIYAVRGPTIYGSGTLMVQPGPLDHYGVEPERIWTWRGEPLAVSISARDAYDNVRPNHSGSVTVSSSLSLFLARSVSNFVDGVAAIELTWDTAALADRVLVTDGVQTGSSVAVDSLAADCADPPTAALTLDGAEDVTACLSSSGATVAADFSQSALGGAGFSHFLVDDGLNAPSRTGSSTRTLGYPRAGYFPVTLLIVDSAACADLAVGHVWANDKGAPAGEVSVAVAHSTRTAGAAASDADTTVSVSAYDCAGDRAASATLCARTDLGELSAGLSSTGAGLCLTLDAAGQGSFTWSAQQLAYDGTAEVVVGVPSGAAFGSTSLSVSGDNHRPEVAWWDTGGRLLGTVDALRIGFTEPLVSMNYTGRVTLAGPSGAVSVTASLEADGRELVVTPASPVNAGAGVWTLGLSSLIRDDSGNRLSGDWSGAVSGFTLIFGDVPNNAPSLSCSVSTETFVPDGDNGSGEDADEVVFSPVAGAVPSWWRLEAYDADGQLRRTLHLPASSTTDPVGWDARGDDGRVVPAGEWELALYAVDGQNNLSDPCFASVEVVERYGEP